MIISSISKEKIPKQLSYVLKTSQLIELLEENNINIHIDLIYRKPQEIGSIFECFYWEKNKNIQYPRLYIRAGVVIKEDIQDAKIKLKDTILKEFLNWLKEINASNFIKKPYFNGLYKNNRVQIIKTIY